MTQRTSRILDKILVNERMNIPSLDFGSPGESLVFLHANGYPPACYRPLLELLGQDHHINAMVQRPLWPGSDPSKFTDWRRLTDDLLQFLAARFSEPVLAVGHSMGGIALLRAALYWPERFKAIVLLDPVLFPRYMIVLWQLMCSLGLGYRLHPLLVTTRRRRRQFDDLERLAHGYRRKAIFRYMDDRALKAYVEGISCEREDGGYELCYPIEWETRIYMTSIWSDLEIWRRLPALSVPAFFIRGEESKVFWASTAHRAERTQPGARLASLACATHLVPLERPQEVHALIHSFFKEVA